MRYIPFFSLLIFMSTIAGCKKDTKGFEMYSGSWKCTNFSSSRNARGNSSIGSWFTLDQNNKLNYSASFPDTGSIGGLKQIKDIYDFNYNISTTIINGSQLIINESYSGIKNDTVRAVFNHSETIQLIEGTTEYKFTDNSSYNETFTITPESIRIVEFGHDSNNSFGNSRTMTKIK